MMIDRTPRWSAGESLAIAWPGGIALVAAGAGPETAERLWATVRAESQLGVFLKTLAASSGGGFLDLPDFVVAVRDGERWQVAVRGSAELAFHAADGVEALRGEGVTTWAEKSLDATRGLRLTLSASSGVEGPLIDGVGFAGALQIGEPVHEAFAPLVPVPVPVHAPDPRNVPLPAPVPASEWTPAPDPPAPAPSSASELSETLADEEYEEDLPEDEAAGEPVESVGEAAAPAEAEENPYSALWDRSMAFDVEAAAVREDAASGSALIPQAEDDQREGATVVDESLAGLLIEMPGDPGSERVLAKLCDRGHPNPPERAMCFVCDAPVGGSARFEVRPQLGWLRVEGGETVPLTGAIIAGRNPSSTAARTGEPARLLALPYAHVSGTHLAIRLEGWCVLVQDLRSSNGTYLRRHDKPPVRLPEAAYPLVPGDLIDLGKGLFLHFDRIP